MEYFVRVVVILCDVMAILIVIRSLLSWFPVDRHNILVQFLETVTDPILLPLRRIIPRADTIDFSPMVAILLLITISFLLDEPVSLPTTVINEATARAPTKIPMRAPPMESSRLSIILLMEFFIMLPMILNITMTMIRMMMNDTKLAQRAELDETLSASASDTTPARATPAMKPRRAKIDRTSPCLNPITAPITAPRMITPSTQVISKSGHSAAVWTSSMVHMRIGKVNPRVHQAA